MRVLFRDVKHSVRLQWRDWRYTAMVVLTLAVCIGANAAMFTVVHSVLLQPLPVPGADQIVLMANRYPKAGVGDLDFSAAGDYYDRLGTMTALEDQAMFNFTSQSLESHGVPEQLTGMGLTPSLFRLLRVAPALGRAFTDSEGEIGSEQKVILSHALWQQLYAANPAAIGQELRLSGRPFTIVGVMPRDFLFINAEVRFWIPLAFTAEQKVSHHSNNWYNIGRLRPGASLEQVQAQVDALNASNLDRFPQWREVLINAGFHTKVAPLKDLLVGDVKGSLYLLWAGAGFVLLIGTVNIASIVMARTSVRSKELGTRLALGASLVQLARQLVVENLVLALAGGLAGLALSTAFVRALAVVGFDRLPRATEVRVDATVLMFALVASLLTGCLIALLPLGYISRFGLASILRESDRTGTGGRRSQSVRRILVVAQVAIAFVLLTGAGLLLASFRELLKVDPGFATEGIVTASTLLPPSRDASALRDVMNRSLEVIRRLPGVTAAGATTGIPFTADYNDSVILAEGYPMKPGESLISPLQVTVTPGYFEAMGVGLVRGRYFDERDNEQSPRVVIIDQRLAEKFWRDRDPIGRRMYLPSGPDLMKIDESTVWLAVVGVVRSVRLQNLAGTGNPNGIYYFPYAQNPHHGYALAIKASQATSSIEQALRRELAQVDPTLAMFDLKTMAERAELSLSSRKGAISLALAFGGIALFLSAVGIYGVLSYLVEQRRREIGIRMAVGSSQAAIFRLFFRDGVVLVAAGLALGLAAAAMLRKVIEAEIYGIRPFDPLVLIAVIALLGTIALAACVWPARQATKVDPTIVLSDH